MEAGTLLLLLLTALLGAARGAAATLKCESAGDRPDSSMARASLYQDIFCDYDTRVQPKKDLVISVELLVRRARVDHRTMEMKVLANLWWTDPFLTWDPARYEDIQQIQFSTDKIWTPTIGTITTLPWFRNGAAQEGLWPAVCHVTSNGTIGCTSAMDMGGACFVSYRFWPHVRAICSAFIGLDFRVEKGVRLAFHNTDETNPGSTNPELLNYVPDNDWVVNSMDRQYLRFITDNNLESVALGFTFKLHSRGAVLATALLGPVVVLSLLLLGSFCLPISSHGRLGLCCCSTVGTIIATSLLFEKLPPFEGPNPIIVTVYSGLLVLSTIAILMTLLLNIVVPQERKLPVPPRWLYSLQSWLISTTFGKIILRILIMFPHEPTGELAADVNNMREDNAESASPLGNHNRAAHLHLGPHKIWDFITSFLNRCLFLIFLMICVALSLYLIHGMMVNDDTDDFNLGID